MKILLEGFLIFLGLGIAWNAFRKAQINGISSYFIKVPKIISLICGNPLPGNKAGLAPMLFQLIILGWVVFWVGMVVSGVEQKTRLNCFYVSCFAIILMEAALDILLFILKKIKSLCTDKR